MNKYKIFQFSFGDGYAGSAKVAILSSKLLKEKGHQITLFATKGSLTEKRSKEFGLNVIALDSTLSFKELIKPIIEIFREGRPEFVISHHSLDRKVGFKLKRKFRNKFINIGYRHNITKSFPVVGAFLYNIYYDALIACGGGVAESLISSGIKKKKVKVIYNGISVPDNIDTISGESVRKKFNPGNKIILGLSTWFHKERKGFDILFNAFSKLDEKFILLLAGIPGERQDEVINYASEFGIDKSRMIFPGYVENIWEYYKAMDIFLLPSRSEGFSLALLEAAAAKLPIVASNIPGNNEFIRNNENGIMFNINEPDALKEGILKLTADRGLADKISLQAQNDVMNNFLITHYADNLEQFLSELRYT
ncbi:MAG: glycosyltransferase [Ignavibacteriaceae bacterium]